MVNKVNNISELHQRLGLEAPINPLLSVIDMVHFDSIYKIIDRPPAVFGFYSIILKIIDGDLVYGRNRFDFSQGSMVFISPGQMLRAHGKVVTQEGVGLFFQEDLIRGTLLDRLADKYVFFNYEINEALHVSEAEKIIINRLLADIKEASVATEDEYTPKILVSLISLLLTYAEKFYSRQFQTRSHLNNDLISQFERHLNLYFQEEQALEQGLPTVSYFADSLSLSPSYLSDLLHRYTGISAQEHIHKRLIQESKRLLSGTDLNISEIAYRLGFKYPSHFTKFFKTKTARSPKDYREQDAYSHYPLNRGNV